MSFNDIPHSKSPRANHADVTNAPHLFGDPFDDETGDPDLYGDPDDFGDPTMDPMASYMIAAGDVAPRKNRLKSVWAKNKGLTAGLGGAAVGATATALLLKRQNKIKAQETLRNQVAVRTALGKIDKRSKYPFFGLKGALMNSAPIDTQASFAADTLKTMFDRQSLDTPFYQETAIATYAAGVFTATASGVAASRFAPSLFLQFGTNTLNASPGTIISISASIPLFDGSTLTISTTPFLFTYQAGFDVRFAMTPWILVANKPIPVMAYYSNAKPIVFTITGLPQTSSVNLVIPGSLHPWAIAMRNALV